ncbi:hypothetical protein NE865_09648 [Phthorimaea operculella]|nr:hypothetical protein NE865_09648 [Phthorimaea operculella]
MPRAYQLFMGGQVGFSGKFKQFTQVRPRFSPGPTPCSRSWVRSRASAHCPTCNIPCTLFADDISLVFPHQDNANSNLNETLNKTLNEVSYWLQQHNLELNCSKTKIMQFRPYQKRALDINFSFQNIPLNCVDTSNLLGLEIDTYINWKPHIQKIASKLSRFTYALSELKKTTNQTTATSAYYAYANSWLSYGIILWGNSTDVKDLFKLQKRCIRIITNISQDESCRPHFRQQNILTLTSMYIFETAKFVRKHKYIFPNDKDPPNSRLRPRNKMAIPFSRMKMFCSGPYTMGIKIYNNIPSMIKSEEKDTVFNSRLKTYLIQKSFYTLQEYFDNTLHH